jgi:hypothetical protein
MGGVAAAVGGLYGLSGTAAVAAGAGTLAVGAAAAGAGVSSLLAPKAPGLPKPTPMPDQAGNPMMQQQLAAQQMFRTGRASTVLTNNQDTSDKLGP